MGARGEQLRIAREAELLLQLEATLKDERLRSVEESCEVERARNERDSTLVKALRGDLERANASSLELTKQLARERERGAMLDLRLAQRDEQASALVEELRAAEQRGEDFQLQTRVPRIGQSACCMPPHTGSGRRGSSRRTETLVAHLRCLTASRTSTSLG